MAACTQCGQRTAPAARWCHQCGTPVPDVSFGAGSGAAYDPPALIDIPAASASAGPAAAAPPLTVGPPPPPPAQHRGQTHVLPPRPRPEPPLPPPPTGGSFRPPPGIIAAAAAAAVVVVILIVVILLSGDEEPAADGSTGAVDDSATTQPTEIASDANVDVPGTAPDGNDAAGNTVSYAAANLNDGDPSTTWRMAGDATGEEIDISWSTPVTITEVGLINGYAKVDEVTGDERYGQNRRVLAATWIFADGTEVSRTLEETTAMQTFALDSPVKAASVRIRIDETSTPGGRDFTAISELSFLAR